jgi:hypothetical protein
MDIIDACPMSIFDTSKTYHHIVVGSKTGTDIDANTPLKKGTLMFNYCDKDAIRCVSDTTKDNALACSYTAPEIHGLKVSNPLMRYVGTRAFNNDYYWFTPEGELMHSGYLLNSIDKIDTEDIDLSSISENSKIKVALKIPDNIQVDFIFIMNPFGFERNYRYCSNHTDPNRDLTTQSTKEMQILTRATKEKYDLVIDFHEATCDGTFFYAYNQKGKKYANNILSYLEKQNVFLENEYVDVILKVKNGLLYSAFYAQWYMKLKGSVTTGMYFNDRGISLVFTVETPKRGDFEERCRIIKLIFEKVIS